MTHEHAEVPEITPLDLVRALESGAPLQLVDVRSAERVAAGRIDLTPAERFHHQLGSQLVTRTSVAETGLDAALPVVTVCGHGNSSRASAAHLRALGLDARSLRGGMAAYMNLVVTRELAPLAGLDRLLQLDRVGKGALAYVLVSAGEALVIDPARDLDPVLAAARESGARITAVVDTHAHADYISGGPALARECGCEYHLHPADSNYAYDGTPGRLRFAPMAGGQDVCWGRHALRVEHTPGHTEGSCSLMLGDAVAFTGDFVFVESVGRPDLAGRAGEWAPVLWQSLERARATWPAGALVLPAHYAGEAERNADHSVGRTFAGLLAANSALIETGRDAFLAWAAVPGEFPAAYRTIKAINVGLHAADEREAEELEVGRNECAIARRP